MATQEKIEQSLERMMYASRWILAPIKIGLSLALLVLSVKFFQELYHFLPHILAVNEADLILKLLTSNDKLMWYVLMHLTLVISALLMGYLDKLTKH